MSPRRTRVFTLVLLAAAVAAARPAHGAVLAELRQLKLQQIQARGFTLPAATTVKLSGVVFQRSDVFGELSTAWILDGRSRRVVWESTNARLAGRTRETRKIEDQVSLPAGDYEAYYSTFATNAWRLDGDLDWWEMVRSRGLDIGDYEENAYLLKLTIEGAGTPRPLQPGAARNDPQTLLALVEPAPNARLSRGFQLTRPAEVEIYSLGELSEDARFDYGWIVDTATRRQVWSLDWKTTEPAGGAHKNRRAQAVLRLPAGKYAAYFVADDSHGPGKWNSQPPHDPGSWGITVRLRNPADRQIASAFDVKEPAETNVILAMTRLGDSEHRESGFTLKQPTAVRVLAVGEGRDGEMFDYAWIVDARTRNKIWTMRYGETQCAGGAVKNRVADTVLQLPAGSYLVGFVSDGSHSFTGWNASPPTERERWGVTVYGVGPDFTPARVAPFREVEATGKTLVSMVKVRDERHEQARFSLPAAAPVRIVAVGEGRDGKMYDYGWIEDARGRPVWQMSYRATDAAGGSTKNRLYQGTVQLGAGQYTAHFVTDDSHAFGDWNDDPPRQPDAWGMTIALLGP